MTSQGLRDFIALGGVPSHSMRHGNTKFFSLYRRKIRFAWKLGPDWRSSELELIAFRHTSTAENLGLEILK